MIQRRQFLATTAGGITATMAGCIGGGEESDAEILDQTLTLSTTTSTYNTGLLHELNAAFAERFGTTVDAIPQGTGQALETARSGDVDVVMVHARSLEDKFLKDGDGVNRRDLMFNDFIVVGPEDDPAGINDMNQVTKAFEEIAENKAIFISRGDNSGTHTKECEIWDKSQGKRGGEWYREIGSGMGEALNQAHFDSGYTLSDRGTYLSQRSELDTLSIHVEGPIEDGPDILANPYGIIAVNPTLHKDVKYDLAMSYIGFITSPKGQEIIEEYTVDGERLFFPESISEQPKFQQYVPKEWEPDEE